MEINNFCGLNKQNILDLYDKSLEVISNFSIGDVFLEDYQDGHVTLHNGAFKNRINNTYNGYALRGTVQTKDILFMNNNINFDNLYQNLNLLKQYSEQKLTPNINFESFQLKNIQFKPVKNQELEALMLEMEQYLKNNCPIIIDSQINYMQKVQKVLIINNEGRLVQEDRFFTRFVYFIVVSKNNQQNSFYNYCSSRIGFKDLVKQWKGSMDVLINRANIIIDAKETVSGTMPILFKHGSPGTLIHEAVGHSLEADFNRLKTSCFSESLNTMIASPILNIIDDGTLKNHNGTCAYDDEGTPQQKNVLVKNGKLIKYLSDRKSGSLMGCGSSGNGRRQNFKTPPLPRMTNTFVMANTKKNESTFEEMKHKYKKCVYVVNVGHGAVDIASGQFSFTADEAYLIENGRETPLRSCVFSGLGGDVLKNIENIGGEVQSDPGHCGKNGSWVPVTCGQSSLLVKELTLG